jgi:hypothetical protein
MATPIIHEEVVWESIDEIQRLLFAIHLWHEHGDAHKASGPTFSFEAREQAAKMKPPKEFGGGARETKVFVGSD